MKLLAALLSAALFGLLVAGCGGGKTSLSDASSSATTGTTAISQKTVSRTVVVGGYVRGDDDADKDTYNFPYDDDVVRKYGHAASAADVGAVTKLLRNYYAAAYANDGAAACKLVLASVANSVTLSKMLPHDYWAGDTRPLPHGQDCAQFMTGIFKSAHPQLVTADVSTMKASELRLLGVHGLAVLAFKTAPERYIPVEREGSTWKVAAPLDAPLP